MSKQWLHKNKSNLDDRDIVRINNLNTSQIDNNEINQEDDLIPVNDLYWIQTGMKTFYVHKVNTRNKGPSPRYLHTMT